MDKFNKAIEVIKNNGEKCVSFSSNIYVWNIEKYTIIYNDSLNRIRIKENSNKNNLFTINNKETIEALEILIKNDSSFMDANMIKIINIFKIILSYID